MTERFIFTRYRTLRCSHSGSRTFGAQAPAGGTAVALTNPRVSHLAVLTLRFYRTIVHHTNCYHCGEDADQVIKAVSTRAQVICSACGATRIFIPRFENTGAIGIRTSIGCYDVWEYRGRRAMQKLRGHGPARPHDRVQPLRDPVPQLRLCALLPVQPGVYGEMPSRRSRRGQRSSRTIATACFGHSFAQMPHPLQ